MSIGPSSSETRPGTGNIAAALKHVSARLQLWREQRSLIAAEIRQIIDLAETLLRELDQPDPSGVRRSRLGGRPAGYRVSIATRAKLRAAWARRKARAGSKQALPVSPAKSNSKGNRRMSAAAKARIAAAQKRRWAAWRKEAAK